MHEPFVTRGFLAGLDVAPPLVLTFRFNPTTLRDNKEVRFAETASDLTGVGPGRWYSGGGARRLSFTLELIGTEAGQGDVERQLAVLRSFLYPAEDAFFELDLLGGLTSGRQLRAPPRALFGYGPRVLECVVLSLDVSETQFSPDLRPVRAQVGVELAVVEQAGAPLYELDRLRRNSLAALGLLDPLR